MHIVEQPTPRASDSSSTPTIHELFTWEEPLFHALVTSSAPRIGALRRSQSARGTLPCFTTLRAFTRRAAKATRRSACSRRPSHSDSVTGAGSRMIPISIRCTGTLGTRHCWQRRRRSPTKRLSLALAIFLAASACHSASVSAPASSIPEFEQRLDNLRESGHIAAITAAIAKGQQVVWAEGFGLADISTQRPAADTTTYHLASLTKPFASTVLLELLDEGKISLDDPVSKYGINLTSSGIVRVRHLLSMTSEGSPGTKFLYNGDRFALLESVITQGVGEIVCRCASGANHRTHSTQPDCSQPADFFIRGHRLGQLCVPGEPGSRIHVHEWWLHCDRVSQLLQSGRGTHCIRT